MVKAGDEVLQQACFVAGRRSRVVEGAHYHKLFATAQVDGQP